MRSFVTNDVWISTGLSFYDYSYHITGVDALSAHSNTLGKII